MKFFYDSAHIGSRLASNSGASSGQNQNLHNTTAWFFWYHCWVQCDEASVQPCQLTVSHTAAQQGTGLGAVVDSLVVVVELSNLGGHLPNLPSLQPVASVQHLSVQQDTHSSISTGAELTLITLQALPVGGAAPTCAAAGTSTAWCRRQRCVQSRTATACVHTEEGLCGEDMVQSQQQQKKKND